jgi:hypothetical protein
MMLLLCDVSIDLDPSWGVVLQKPADGLRGRGSMWLYVAGIVETIQELFARRKICFQSHPKARPFGQATGHGKLPEPLLY